MIGLRRTYSEVAHELATGLESGKLTLENESTDQELSFFAALLFQYLAPRKLAFAVGTIHGIEMLPSNAQLMVQFDPKVYESLPEEVRVAFDTKMQELIERGVKIKAKDLNGKPINMFKRGNLHAVP
jgi:hypothetical protein